ncbi:MAG: DUF4352 domain-containing protein [Lachnospiraceae bacterium]|nr:DUF4352 domain-containing protein [Lachnospiraceae bacterium]
MRKIRNALALTLGTVLFTAVALGSGSSSNNSSAKKVGEVETETSSEINETKKEEKSSSKAQSELKDAYYVGDTLDYKGLAITFVSSSYYESNNDFIQPKDGNQYIRLEIHVDNNSGSDKNVSTYDFNCYADGYECEKTYNDDDLSASLSDGRSADGAVYFEVPSDANEIEIEYEVDWLNDKKAKFIFEGDKNSGLTFETKTSKSDEVFHPGDIIETKNMKITYSKCAEYVSDNMFLTPKDGNKYIYIELEVENTSDSDQTISYFSFECYADGSSCEGFYGMDDGLSASLSAGRKAKGTVAFEVPQNAQTIELDFEDNFWTQNKIIFLYEE